MDRSSELLVVVDVGGMGGLQAHWQPFADQITPVVFEPNPAEAALLRPAIERYPGGQVVERALAHQAGRGVLNVAKAPGCSSLLRANTLLLGGYSIAPAFAVQRQVPVDCVRYDALFRDGVVPRPDVIKIDVQGFEYEVLTGFGTLLDGCLGVQLEAHLYPIYQGQKLLSDLVLFLARFGLMLRRVTPVAHFDGDVVEVDAWFTLGRGWFAAQAPERLHKLAMVLQAWGLAPQAPQFAPTTWD